jgi:hypothetical protein
MLLRSRVGAEGLRAVSNSHCQHARPQDCSSVILAFDAAKPQGVESGRM